MFGEEHWFFSISQVTVPDERQIADDRVNILQVSFCYEVISTYVESYCKDQMNTGMQRIEEEQFRWKINQVLFFNQTKT